MHININTIVVYFENLLIPTIALIVFILLFIFVIKRAFISAIQLFIDKNKPQYINPLKNNNFFKYITNFGFALYFLSLNNILGFADLFPQQLYKIYEIFINIYTTVSIILVLLSLINSFHDVNYNEALSKNIPIHLYIQIIKIFIVICGIIIVVSHAINISIISLFTSLGAATAFLTFIFKDTFTGLVSSLQIAVQGIIRVGDIISIPSLDIKYGTVEAITISIVKIRNQSSSISTIPTSNLLTLNIIKNNQYQNKGIIKESISFNIDINTIKMCSDDMLKVLKIKNYYYNYSENVNELSNISLYKNYINHYLSNYPYVNKHDLSFYISQYDITLTGLPISIDLSINESDFIKYRKIKASISEHLLIAMNYFDLKVYQSSI